ncbi:hypothetical protein JQK15_20515 [Sphingobium sp. BHU LFT2]|uniref:hypothetical protein n=1 Tax=Sphingobium sp. BHU LFT2 TaxID=2807634 RepID=UPI001BE9AB80|nr:hypothetical protein [Sphingobium sp. BHU LFT2]MBT2245899.1 hypothetical protein [Sphingobium sp. BHU LFT2]
MIGTLEHAATPSRSAGAQTPPTIPALPLQPGKLYLRLYHGRATPDEQMEDWGSDGPVIGPLASIHVTYTCHLKFAAAPDVMERFFPEVMAQWQASGVSNGHGPLCDWQFNVIDDLIEYGGILYGDWSTFLADDHAAR